MDVESARVRAPRRRVAKAPEERREDLLQAARSVFAEKGIPGTTVADIAEAAGVAKGTFYLYFDSKEVLLGALKERFADDLIARATSLLARVGRDDWWALVDATAESMIDFMLENRDLIQVFVQEGLTPETSGVFADTEARLRDMFATGIKAGVEAGAFRVSDPVLTASLLQHAVRGTTEHLILYGEGLDRDRVVAGAKELIRKALRP